ncbi:hypothetical protein [Planctomycetes bacterium K23_9]|uniref:Uncharacterized protein n=1 Tax=Stieleria marina TaxID=1930275 RepID=A0A517NN84_9BACT|nr:hypothetical protein K239x_05100 [Planctomycetes bacterium K23_9]
MTVAPQRPQDGNRRPKIRNSSAQQQNAAPQGGDAPQGIAANAVGELPPVLFQLPNLNPAPTAPVSATCEEPVCEINPSVVESLGASTTAVDAMMAVPAAGGPASGGSEAITGSGAISPEITLADNEPEMADRSIAARLFSHAMILGIVGLGATWIYVVAKNVRTSSGTQTAEVVDEDAASPVDETALAKSTVSLEDTVANAERLSLGSGHSLSAVAKPSTAKISKDLSTNLPVDLIAQADAAAKEAQATLERESAGTPSPKAQAIDAAKASQKLDTQLATDSSVNRTTTPAKAKLDSLANTNVATTSDSFAVTMPNAVMTKQTSAKPVSDRKKSDSGAAQVALTSPQQNAATGRLSAADASVPATPKLPVASDKSSEPVASRTPNGLTPPLPQTAMTAPPSTKTGSGTDTSKKNQDARRYSKTPSAVGDWLKYLPPAPQK